jgi:hypothetical protein
MVTKEKKTPAAKQVEAQQIQRTSAKDWLLSRRGTPVECPSGNVALLRRPGPEMFFKAGMIPDALTGIVNEGVREKQGLRPEKVKEIADDPAMLGQMMLLIDSAVCEAVVDPPVRMNPSCIAPLPSDAAKLCEAPQADSIHSDSKLKDHHKFIEGDAIPEDDRDPMFLYCAEVDFTDKTFIFQYAVGGSADLERFREEYSELVAGISAEQDSPK